MDYARDELTPLDPERDRDLAAAMAGPDLEDEAVLVTAEYVPDDRATSTLTGSSGGADYGDNPNEAELEKQIEQTRAEMGQTIEALQAKLSPQNLVDEAKGAVRDATVGKAEEMVNQVETTVSDAVDTAEQAARSWTERVLATIQANPVPAALAGIGLGWLFVSARNGQNTAPQPRRYPARQGYGTGYGYAGRNVQPYGYVTEGGSEYTSGSDQGVTGTVSQAVNTAQNVAGQAVDQVQNVAGQVAGGVAAAADEAQNVAGQAVSQVGDVAAQTASQAQDAVAQLGYQAGEQVQQVSSGLQQMIQERPLAVAAGALALGVALGLAIPETRREDELLGPVHDQLASKAQQTVQQTAQKVQTVAQDALQTVEQDVKQQV